MIVPHIWSLLGGAGEDEGCSQGSELQVNYKQDSLNGHQQLVVIALEAEVGRGRDIGAILHLLL